MFREGELMDRKVTGTDRKGGAGMSGRAKEWIKWRQEWTRRGRNVQGGLRNR
jgi:hypothetical protein